MMKHRPVKKIGVFLFIAVLLTVAAGSAMAQQTQSDDGLGWWGSYYMPGNINAGVVLGASFRHGFNLDVFPNFERKMFKWRPGDFLAIDFGLGLRGILNLYTGDDWYPGHFGFGAGPYGSFHMGFRGFEKVGVPGFEYLERVDLFSSFGVNYQMYVGDIPPDSGIYFSNFSGLNYFINDMFALSLTTSYQRRFDNYSSYYRNNFSGGIGIQLRFGPKEQLKDPPNPTWLYFQSIYAMSVGFSGGFDADGTYEIGDETTFRMTMTMDAEGEDPQEVEWRLIKALLHRTPDASRSWWRITMDIREFEGQRVGGVYPSDFEILVNDRHDILQIRYMDVNSGRLTVLDPADPSAWRRQLGVEMWGQEERTQYYLRSEEIQVAAGTFQADVYYIDDMDMYPDVSHGEVTVWLSSQVPGLMVKYQGHLITHDGIENKQDGELESIRRGVTSPWTRAW